MSRHQALEEFGGLNLIRIAVVKDLTATHFSWIADIVFLFTVVVTTCHFELFQ